MEPITSSLVRIYYWSVNNKLMWKKSVHMEELNKDTRQWMNSLNINAETETDTLCYYSVNILHMTLHNWLHSALEISDA